MGEVELKKMKKMKKKVKAVSSDAAAAKKVKKVKKVKKAEDVRKQNCATNNHFETLLKIMTSLFNSNILIQFLFWIHKINISIFSLIDCISFQKYFVQH